MPRYTSTFTSRRWHWSRRQWRLFAAARRGARAACTLAVLALCAVLTGARPGGASGQPGGAARRMQAVLAADVTEPQAGGSEAAPAAAPVADESAGRSGHPPTADRSRDRRTNCGNGVTPCNDTLYLAPNTSVDRSYTTIFSFSDETDCRIVGGTGVTCFVLYTPYAEERRVRITAGGSPVTRTMQLYHYVEGFGEAVLTTTTVIVTSPQPCGSLQGTALSPCDTSVTVPVGATRDVIYSTSPAGGGYRALCDAPLGGQTTVVSCAVVDTVTSGSAWRVRFTGVAAGTGSGRVRVWRANGDSARSTVTLTAAAVAPCGNLAGVTLAPCDQPQAVIVGNTLTRAVTWSGGALASVHCVPSPASLATCSVAAAGPGAATLTVVGGQAGTGTVTLVGIPPGSAVDSAKSVLPLAVYAPPAPPTCAYGTTPCDPALYLRPQHDTTVTFTSSGWPSAALRCTPGTSTQQLPPVSCTLLPGATTTQASVRIRASDYLKGWVTLETYVSGGYQPVTSPLVVANGGAAPGPACTSPYGLAISPCDTVVTVKPNGRQIVYYAATRSGVTTPDVLCSPNTYSQCTVMGREDRIITVGYTGLALGQEAARFRVALGPDTARSIASVSVTNAAAPPPPCATKTGIRVLPCDTTLSVRTGEFVDVQYRFTPTGSGYVPSCTSTQTVRCTIDTVTTAMVYRVRYAGCAVGSAAVPFRGVHAAGDTARTVATVTVTAGATPGPECAVPTPQPGPGPTPTPGDTVAPPPVATPPAGRIFTAGVYSGTTVERGACVTIPVARDAAYECGELRLVYGLRPITTYGREWAPALTYNTGNVRPSARVRVGVRVTTPPGTGADTVTLSLTVDGSTVTRKLPRTMWPDTLPRYFVLSRDLTGGGTGLYRYTVRVNLGGGVVDSARGMLAVVDRDAGAFGSGWWLAGYERLHRLRASASVSPSADTLLWAGGDGSTRLYVATDVGSGQPHTTWVAESFTRPDTLRLEGGTQWVRLLPDGATVRFDLTGRQTAALDRRGEGVTYTHDGQGRLTAMHVPPTTGRVRYTFGYDSTGLSTLRLVRQGTTAADSTVLDERVVTRSSGRITQIAELGGTVLTRYEYGQNGDPTRFVTTRIDRRGTPQRFSYSSLRTLSGSQLTATAASGATQLIAHTFCAGEIRGLESCALGAMQSPTAFTTIYDGPRTDVADVTRFVIDRFGAPVQVTDPLGEVTKVRYHATFPGLVERTKTPGGRVARMTYDARGRLLAAADSNALGDGRETRTDYAYDVNCPDLPERVAPVGELATTYTYYPGSCLLRTAQAGADTARRVTYAYRPGTALVDSTRTPDAPGPTRFDYDSLGNVRTETSPANALRTRVGDVFGRDSVLTSPSDTGANRVVRLTYDQLGYPFQAYDVVPGDTMIVSQTFDGEGNLVTHARTARYGSSGSITLTDNVQLDQAERPIRQSDTYRPGSNGVLTYDPAGNLLSTTDRRGNALTMTYDVVGRMLTRSGYQVSDGFAYGPRGTWAVAWNAEGRDSVVFTPGGLAVAQHVRRGGNGGRPVVGARLRWDYDLNGRVTVRTRVVGTDSATLGYGYDAEGRFERLRGFDGRDTRLTYDVYGRPDVLTLGNGGRISLEVPWTGALSEKRYRDPAAIAANSPGVALGMRYAYDARLGRYDGGGVGATDWRRYTWDPRGRLASSADGTTGDCVPTYGTGGSQAIRETFPGEAPTSFQCVTTVGAPTAYTYDAFGNRTSGTTLGVGHRLQTATVAGVGHTFEHDNDGNVTRKYRTGTSPDSGLVLTWDGLGQLRTARAPMAAGGQLVEYGYDASGLRVRRTAGGQTVYSLWDGEDLAAEVDGATGTTQRQFAHYPGVDQPHSVRAGGPGAPVYYHAQDALGHVVALLDAAGAVVGRRWYQPFGDDRVLADSGQPIPDAFRWKARERDPSTGLYYVRARWYDPDVGRFLSEDPLGLEGGVNPYAFAENDPVNLSDPSGLQSCETTLLQAIPWEVYASDPEGARASVMKACGTGTIVVTAQGVSQWTAMRTVWNHPEVSRGINWEAMQLVHLTVPSYIGGPTGGVSRPSFIVNSAGQVAIVPRGATGPFPPRASGFQFLGGRGGYGLSSRVSGIRFMDANKNQGRRINYMNSRGQTVDPLTGRTIPNSDPRGHLPYR
jgi:RHS repeat-associated protein